MLKRIRTYLVEINRTIFGVRHVSNKVEETPHVGNRSAMSQVATV